MQGRFLLLFSFICFLSFGQQTSFIQYNIDDGLIQSQVKSMYQADNGYMWISTLAGLSRFDGHDFVNITTKNGLPHSQIHYLTGNNSGALIGGTKGGFFTYDNDIFTFHSLGDDWQKYNVSYIALENDNSIYLATNGAGIFHWTPEKLTHYTEENGLPDDVIRTILIAQNGTIWAGSRNGMRQLANNQWVSTGNKKLDSLNVSAVEQDSKGNLWISTYGNYLIKYNNDEVIEYDFNNQLSDFIRGVFIDREGQIWVWSNYGVGKLSENQIQIFNFNNGLPYNNITSIIQDFESSIWIGSNGAGVFRLAGEQIQTFGQNEGLSGEVIITVLNDSKGNKWFGSHANGLSVINKNGEKIDLGKNAINNPIYCAIEDKDGIYWLGSNTGLYKCTLLNNEFKYDLFTTKNGLTHNKVNTLKEKDGKIWIGTKGLSYIESDQIITIENTPQFKRVRNIKFDKDNNIWLATSSGVMKLMKNKETYVLESIVTTKNTFALEIDNNEIWIGCSDGLFHIEDSVRHIVLGDGFGENHVNFLNFTSDHILITGTNNGVFYGSTEVYKNNSLNLKHIGTSEGLPILETNLNSSFIDKEKNFWFGTTKGAVCVNKGLFSKPEKKITPYINLLDVRLNLDKTNWNEEGFEVKDKLPLNLILPYIKNHLTFDFTGISFYDENSVKYQYMLESFDKDWQPLTSYNFATYSNLPGSNYTFRVKAINKYGIWSNVSSFSFEILPPFWQRWWFYLSSVLLVGFIGFIIYKWQVSLIHHQQQEERLENKARMLALEHQSLNSSMNRHFIFNALNSIQYYINRQDKKLANRYLSKFAKLIRMNLDSSQAEFTTLNEEIERLELYLYLEHMRFQDKFEYSIKIGEEVDPESVEVPSMLLQPFLENSIWHGILPMKTKGKVSLTIDRISNEKIQLIIEDNGIGVEASKKLKIDQNNHISQGMHITSSRIELLKEINKDNISLKGPYQIHNDLGDSCGTRVVIILPTSIKSITNSMHLYTDI